MRHTLEAKVCKIQLIDKQIHHPNQMIFANPVLETLRKKCGPMSANPFNEA